MLAFLGLCYKAEFKIGSGCGSGSEFIRKAKSGSTTLVESVLVLPVNGEPHLEPHGGVLQALQMLHLRLMGGELDSTHFLYNLPTSKYHYY